MSKTKPTTSAKFGEPWHCGTWDGDDRHIFDVDGAPVLQYEKPANKERITACINVLKGIDDPEAHMERLRKIEAAALTAMARLEEDSLVKGISEATFAAVLKLRTALGISK